MLLKYTNILIESKGLSLAVPMYLGAELCP